MGIFLPAFIFAAAIYPVVPRLRASAWAATFLDGANAAALGLMVAVVWQLARSSIIDPVTAILGLLAAALLIRSQVNSAWLVLGGAVVGLIVKLAQG